MRLLRMNSDGTFSLIQFREHDVPSYAILSHTWRGEHEPTFQDVIGSTTAKTNENDPNFDKLYFCGKQAKKDRLQYFWVDTCCIDKTSSAELSEAINSMFSWYQRSSKCYVLLTDVSLHFANNDLDQIHSKLRQSRWFTRGWTLQELLASPSVEFFSREEEPFGSKKSLEKQISEITGIPIAALQGNPLSYFSTEEKLTWMEKRQTTREEDSVYSLLGIFDLHMPAMYGEGRQHALQRLQSEIERQLGKYPTYNKKSETQHPVNKWIVPFERNFRFTDRESELAELESKLFANNQYTRIAVCGLGGVGKTQLVLELLHRVRQKDKSCSAIWIQATSMESLDQGYHTVARQLGISDSGAKDVDIKKLVQDYLNGDSAGQWILVYDNADDIQMWIDKTGSKTQQSSCLIDYIPRSKAGRVIFTTRDRKVGVKLAQQSVMEVPKMTEITAIHMLQNCLIDKALVDTRPGEARAMLAWLTHLPLAIAQATAYINENGITLADYLALVECQEQEIIGLLTEEFEDDARYSDSKNPVATTWLISFQQIQQRDPLAAEYMSFMACVDHKNVPQFLLPPGPSRKQEMDAIGTLGAYSFITRRAEDSALDLHRLVQLTIRNWLRNKGALAEWTRKAAARLEEAFPDHEHRNRATWRAYLPHARHILESPLIAKDDQSRMDLEWKIALCYYSDGRFNEAAAYFREVMEFRTSVLGAEHPDTLRSVGKLALAYHAQSLFPEAKALGLRAMEGQKRILGEEDPETLSTMSHLAMTYSDLSQWKEAEELELRTLELRKRVLSVEHPDTLVGMSNLVYLYNCQGWWDEAERLGKETITARKKVLGVEHPDTLLSIGNLAHTYNNQGRYREAEELLVQVMNIRIRVLGEDHPHTLSGMSNLGVSYHNQGRWDEAEVMQSRVVAARKDLLGPEHFSTLTSMAHLSLTYHSQGRQTEAEELGVQVMELRKKVLGPEHHHTLTSMSNLASIYFSDGQSAKAEELLLQALAIRIRVMGMEHHHTLTCMEQLAAMYRKQGRLVESEDLETQVTDARNKAMS
ncbi:kinesin [Pochonia chlamydosporia 170]|uniref:Kinesin n=1 Tax=Pochonia chlamydosporia 170 TaxID=1380566 RepID=A0A179EY44_METCM|nr:kinesin [Pochonia chlamydosporia 170]OAQ58116.1 kinesin [Pochonia chlamydosporia 170]